MGVRGSSMLTYHTDEFEKLLPGQIVKVPVGSKNSFGVVYGLRSAPKFKTKPITSVLDTPPLPSYALDTIEWMINYYAVDASQALRLFMPSRPDINSKPSQNAPVYEKFVENTTLNDKQQSALRDILESADDHWLLHGVTGSGKTALYIALCQRMLEDGKSSVVLVPEIALATQIIGEFQKTLGDSIIITHSHMSERERRTVWRRARYSDKPLVAVGPRSALFMPLDNLGAIVIDECHENSYKQEQAPYYHARDVATYMASAAGAKLVLGSATPGVQDIYLQKKKSLRLVTLPDPIHENTRNVEIVDIRQHKNILSPQLTRAITDTIAGGKQSMLFINRRGSASQVLCSNCGWIARCQNCDIPQTWHGDSGYLRCHWCGDQSRLPGDCPHCHSMKWRFLGFGTKRIETEVRSQFPHATVLRLDKDSFSADTINDVLKRLRSGKIDILIGTQMIAKGLDLPLVSLVGVVLADTMLYIPDMSSSERTYQLLHQIIGRSGREHDSPSQVIIQTYNPEHHVIKAAANRDFDKFMESELADRKELQYPPYHYVLKLTCKRKTDQGAKKSASTLAERIRTEYGGNVTVRGPAPAWKNRVNNYFYWHIIITSGKRERLLDIMRKLPHNWRADIDPVNLL